MLVFLVFAPVFSDSVENFTFDDLKTNREETNPWSEIRAFVEMGLEGLDMTDEAVGELEVKIGQLTAETGEQRKLLSDAQRMIRELRQQLAEARYAVEVAIDRMQDAEDVAVWYVAEAERKMLELQKISRAHKNAWIGGLILGSGFAATGSWTTYGITSGTYTPWSAAPAIGSGLIWVLGHYAFKWW